MLQRRLSHILLLTSALRKSCTILINQKQVCIHDGTWKQCEVSGPQGVFRHLMWMGTHRMDTTYTTSCGKSMRSTTDLTETASLTKRSDGSTD